MRLCLSTNTIHHYLPTLWQSGVTVNRITPQHTLKRVAADTLDPQLQYHFCENPACDLVYYDTTQSVEFTTDQLKNRVTLKDEDLETPLCYCFKVLKRQALEEIARTGTTNVFAIIQSRMKPGQNCFCEKSNPRGDCCTKDVAAWLRAQGITVEIPESSVNSGCCG